MGLLDFKNHNLKIKPEALMVNNIKALWERDKTKSKARAYTELSYIYFVYDPRSDYSYITDLPSRQAKVAGEMALGEDYIEDEIVQNAVQSYIDSTNTVASGVLEDAYYTTNKVREFLRNVEIIDIGEADKVVKSLERIPTLVEKLIKTQKLVNEELEQNDAMRGNQQRKIMEDGLRLIKENE